MATEHTDLQQFALEFRDGLLGTQAHASRRMCATVSMPLRAALLVLQGIETKVVTEDDYHIFLVTADGKTRIDPTIDQFHAAPAEKVQVQHQAGPVHAIQALMDLPFVELLENFKRFALEVGETPCARDAGAFVATYIYYPLAQQGVFDD